MTINERVSPERLNTIKSWREKYGQDANVMIPASEAEAIISELQQYRAASDEPVAFRWRWVDGGEGPGEWWYHDMIHFEAISCEPTRECQLVYAVPQVASVPGKIDLLRAHYNYDGNDFEVRAYQRGWNDCVAAAPAVQAEQLSGNTEQVSQPYTLPADYLQDYKDGCEWSALMAEANHPQTGDWLFDDPVELAKAIRKGPDMLPAAPDFRGIPNSSTNNCRENADSSTKCWCHTCRPVTMTDMRFIVCPECGNKRCPHANDHRNACTGSNEPGQEGSAYPDAPKQEAE